VEIKRLHHIAIICSNYETSKQFYTEILGFKIDNEFYRAERNSYKLDLSLNGQYLIELFSFPNPPQRQTRPEATGLRHISFGVKELENAIERAVVVSKKRKILPEDLPIFRSENICVSSDNTLAGIEKAHISRVLHENDWNISKTAKELGIDRSTLYSKIRRYSIVQRDL